MNLARVLLVDPPWEFRNRHALRKDGRKTRFGIGAASRYEHGVMSVQDIAALPINEICTEDAYLFMWCTWTHLQEALDVIRSWQFIYKTCGFIWCKTYPRSEASFMGPGRYVPANSEPCLFATRGRPWHPNTGKKPEQVVRVAHPRYPEGHPKAGKIIHSRKPSDVHDRIERWLSPHLAGRSMVELFATEAKPGWICLGGDITKRDIRIDLPLLRHQIDMRTAKERLAS